MKIEFEDQSENIVRTLNEYLCFYILFGIRQIPIYMFMGSNNYSAGGEYTIRINKQEFKRIRSIPYTVFCDSNSLRLYEGTVEEEPPYDICIVDAKNTTDTHEEEVFIPDF